MKKKPVPSIDKNNSVKSGPASRGRTEKDMDEQVHSGEMEIPGEGNNEDPDDRVHQLNQKKPKQAKAENNPEDPDDLVHENGDEDDE